MSAGFTSGPWTLTHISGSNFAVQRFEVRGMLGDSPNVYPIFNRDCSAIDGGSVCMSPENARLISAAPCLHAALAALFADYKQLADSGDAGNWKLEEQDVGKQALAALARATGAV